MEKRESEKGTQEPANYPLDLVNKMTKTVDGMPVPEVFPTENVRAAKE